MRRRRPTWKLPILPLARLLGPLLVLPLAATLASRAGADLLLSVKGHADAFSVGDRTQQAHDSDVKIWLSADKMRRDEGPLTAIVRLDRQKLYLVNHADRTYSALDLPVDWKKFVPKGDQEKFQQYLTANQIKATVTPATETRKIRGWNTRRVDVELSSSRELKVSTQIWITKDLGLYAAYNKMSGVLASLQANSADWSHKIGQLDGFPVYQETQVSVGGASFKSREEVIVAETKEVPDVTYDIPLGFTATPYDPFRPPE
jgi:hypothetical protein